MKIGVNAANQRWSGILVKRDFLHTPSQQDPTAEALSIQYQSLHFERAEKAYHWSEHLHDNIEILFIRKGLYTGELNRHEIIAKPGDALIVGPGDTHSDHCTPPLEYFAIWFNIRQAADARQVHILRENLPSGHHVHHVGDDMILKTLDTLFREEQRNSRFSISLLLALANEILWRLLNDLPGNILNPLLVKRTRESELMVQLSRLFEQHLSTPTNVKDIATAMNMSESTLAHACTKLLGVSPAKAFVKYRLEKAANALRHGTQSVKEIADSLGFYDESHFIRSFRKEYGMSPLALRNLKQKAKGA